MNGLSSQPVDTIQSRILSIRGVHVLLDTDLAQLYGVATKAFNQAVKRHAARFPERFCFQLTHQEVSDNWSQIVTSSGKHRGAAYRHWVFTEHGALMNGLPLRPKKLENRSKWYQLTPLCCLGPDA
jgi:hypothetical protein